MQPKLIALAVAGALAAPAAFAATANVDVYGVLNVAVERVDNSINNHTRMTTGNNSALGFRGSEDLGGGIKGIWQIETNVSVDGDNNAGGGAVGALNGTRNVYVGLSGGFGTVLLGVHDTPYKMSTGRLDTFVGTLGDYNSIMGAITPFGGNTLSSNNASALFDLRASNVIAYVSPNLSGFQARLGYALSGETNITIPLISESRAWSADVSYTNGPLFLTGAYEKHDLYGMPFTTGGAIVLNNATIKSGDRTAWKAGAGYKFGDLSLGAMYERIETDPAGPIVHRRNAWMANASYAIGPFTLKAMYIRAGDLSGFPTGFNTGATQWNLGADYALSKRTTVQLVYANLDNKTNAHYQLSQGPNVVTGLIGKDQSGIALGVRHSF